jgi:flagellar biogenesis protein FliO
LNLPPSMPQAGRPGQGRRRRRPLRLAFAAGAASLLLVRASALAQGTKALALSPDLPNTGLSVLRVLGALALVLGLFLGGIWLARHWQRLVVQKGRSPRLNILEVRPLGQRQTLYVVAFEQQRFLIASSPAGVSLVDHLPPADEAAGAVEPAAVPPASFGQIFQQVLARP